MLNKLMPREGKFFDLFNAHAAQIVEGGRALAQFIANPEVSAVRGGIAGNIVLAWILTIPCTAFIAAVAWWLGRHMF